jgi:hypothetical protein
VTAEWIVQEAMVELDAAYRRREGPLVTLAVDPMFREMKDDPRYRGLLAKVELSHSIQRHISG